MLKKVSEKPCSGYDLMKEIEEIRGKKPSPGYIYPLLKDLKENKLISEKKKETKNIYTITVRGKKVLKDLMEHTHKTSEIMLKTFEPISTKKEMGKFHKMHKIFLNKSNALFKDMDIFGELKQEVFRIAQKDYDKKREKLRKVIKKAVADLKKIK